MRKSIYLIIISTIIFMGCSAEEETSSCAYQINGQNRIGWKNNVTKSECKDSANGGWYSTGVSEDTASTMNYRCSYGTCPW